MGRPFSTTGSLTGRNREILSAVVKRYIASGEPVGSRTVAEKRRQQLSPASIRNVMAQLEAEGYLTHPHTSAGRVPTEKAFREYVQHVGAARLGRGDTGLIEDSLEGASSVEERLGRSSHVLATLTRQMGVAIVAPLSESVLEHVHFLRLSEQRVLAVLVARGDVVRHRILRLGDEIRPDELERIANYVNVEFAGWPLGAARREIVRRLEQERAEFDAILKRLRLLCVQGFLSPETTAQIYLEGAPNLVGAEGNLESARVRLLLEALEDKERLIQVLDECLRGEMTVVARAGGETLAVRIGLDDAYPGMQDYAVIGTVCEMEPGAPARIAVIGPTRMPYERVISAVAQVAAKLSAVGDPRSA